MELGAQIGEDVPFFIMGMMAINLGHKQPLVKVRTSGHAWNWVLGVPHRGLSTKAVFQEYDHILEMSSSGEEDYLARRKECIETPWGTSSPDELLSALVNDLETPSMQLLPDISTALEAGSSAGAIASLMSGSGSACVFLAKDEAHAQDLKVQMENRGLFRAVMVASGPVGGVKVLQQ